MQSELFCLVSESIIQGNGTINPLAAQRTQLVTNLEAKKNQGRGRYYDLSIQN